MYLAPSHTTPVTMARRAIGRGRNAPVGQQPVNGKQEDDDGDASGGGEQKKADGFESEVVDVVKEDSVKCPLSSRVESLLLAAPRITMRNARPDSVCANSSGEAVAAFGHSPRLVERHLERQKDSGAGYQTGSTAPEKIPDIQTDESAAT